MSIVVAVLLLSVIGSVEAQAKLQPRPFFAPTGATGDLIKHDVTTQPKCEQIERPKTGDCRWGAGLDMVDQTIEGGRIVAYRIRWFSGTWSNWFVTGVNDLDVKFTTVVPCSIPIKKNSLRRTWSNFVDHRHRFIICKPY